MSQSLPKAQPFLPLGYTSQGNRLVTLTGSDFTCHKHLLGVSGSGKSSYLASVAVFLLRQGIAFMLIDPHGDLAKLVLTLLASGDFFAREKAYDRLWYVDFARTDAAIAFNVLRQPYSSHTIAANLLEVTKRAWPSQSSTALLDNIVLAACFVLAENGMPLTSINRLLLDEQFRNLLLENISDELVLDFFRNKFEGRSGGGLTDSTLRRSFLLTFSPALRNTLGQRENQLNFRALLDNGVSCLFNLGGLDDYTKRFIGCLIVVGIEQAFLSRSDISPEKRVPSHVIIDEFPLFSASGDSFSVILEQMRKFMGTLYLAHQTTSQLSSGVAGSLQNAISIIMKSGYEDSTWLAQRFVRMTEKKESAFDMPWLFGPDTTNPFENARTIAEQKHVFESLKRQEAIVTINNQSVLLTTPTLPQVSVDKKKLQKVEEVYAQKLLTPIQAIERGLQASDLVILPGGRSSESLTVPSTRRAKKTEQNMKNLEAKSVEDYIFDGLQD